MNGDEDTDGTFDMITLGAEVGVGADQAGVGTDPFDGEIAELVVYSSDLSNLNTRKVESYLALKYGIALDQVVATSYLASNCTTVACSGGGEVEMWDSGAAFASTYDNNIAGIGRDDDSALLQNKSRSVEDDSIVIVESASDLEDLEFLTWGNDNGSLTASSGDVPGGLPGSATVRLTREWLAQDNGGDGVGTVTVTFDLNNQSALARNAPPGNYALLIDTDGIFSDAAVHTTGASISGGRITFTTASITGANLYFSIAGPLASGPGDVTTNLEFWAKADAGVFTDAACSAPASSGNDIGCWEDQSASGNDVTEGTGSEQPDLISSSTDRDFNFNASLHFDGGDHLTRATMLGAGNDVSVFAVFRNDSLTGADQIIGFGTDSDDPGLETNGTTLNVRNDASAPATLGHGTAVSTTTTYLASLRAPNGTNTGVDLRLNGDEDTDVTFDMLTLGAEVGIGADQAGVGTDPFDGEIAELIVYSSDLSDLDVRRVESYLALKYGVTIDQTVGTSYLASNCTAVACSGGGEIEMWDSGAADASTYNNDISGIGADISSDLNQMKSRSVNSDAIVIVSNPSDSEDLEFFTWGNDNGSLSTESTEVPGSLPSNAEVRLTREWLAQNNGGDGIGTVTVTFDLSGQTVLDRDGVAGDYALLIDTDGNFSNATVHITGAIKNGDEISFTTADISSGGNGLYFSLAGPSFKSPGDVLSNLQFWVKADKGLYTDTSCTIAASNGNDIACWQDQSTINNDVTESVGGEQPDLISVSSDEDFNFNASIHFDGSDHLTRTTMLSAGDDVSVFAVFRNDSLVGADQIIGFGTDSDDPGLETNGTTLNVRNDGSAPTTLGHGTALTTSTTYLTSFRAPNGTNTGVDLRLNGDEDTDGTFDMLTLGAEVGIGADQVGVGTDPFDGEIAELIVYDADLTDLNIRRVESYLALKYGITIDQTAGTSYLASNCTTLACSGGGEIEMWDSGATDASTYDNDIAGIGQDNISGLLQSKSKSVNTDSMVTIESASDLENLEFLTWGNDNGSVATFSSEVPSSAMPGLANVRLTREWLAQNKGGDGVGTVTVTFDLSAQTALVDTGSASDYAVLIDTDGDFSNATIHTTGASYGSNTVTFTLADIRSAGDGLYFSLAGPGVSSPGSVSANLQMWIKANSGLFTDTGCSSAASFGNDVACWADQSGQGNDMTEVTTTERPDLEAAAADSGFNFNPTINFDGGDSLNRTSLLAPGDDMTVFMVFQSDGTALTVFMAFHDAGSTTHEPTMYFTGTSLNTLRVGGTPNTVTHSDAYTTNATHLHYVKATNGVNAGLEVGFDGDEDSFATFDMQTIAAEFGIGSHANAIANWPLNGDIGEVIVYDANLTGLNLQQVESYLALKYGITLDQAVAQSYLSSNCTTLACNGGGEVMMWDSTATDATLYDNDIVGIGKDASSGLSQIKSKSINSDAMLTVESAFDLDDLEFFSWGNDNGSVTSRSTEVPSGMPANADSRLTREWLAQNNGGDGTGTVTVTFDISTQTALQDTGLAGDYALLIDDDGNFSDATVHTTGASYSSNTITFTTADIRTAGNGLYFTLAGPGVQSPGDVSSGLQFWVRANTGVYTNTGCSSSASDGNDIGCWEDQSMQSNNITEGVSAEQPDLISLATDRDFNFNPSLHFDGGDHLTRATMLGSGDAVSVFAVFRNETLTGADQVIGFGTDSDDPGLETSTTTLNVRNDASAPATLSHGTALTTDTTYLAGFRAVNGTNTGVDLRLNGDEDTLGTFDMLTLGAEVGVGADQADVATDPFDGEIAEIIVYDADLTDVQTRRVESYLAIKYGVSIDQTAGTSYLASNCSTTACVGAGEVEMWDSGAVDASTYDNDIAGIGIDNISSLNQTQSRSVNSDGLVIVSSASDLENLEFFTWGNDDTSLNNSSTEVPGSLPGAATDRLAREWLAQNNGGDGVGTVTVTFDLASQFVLSPSGTLGDYALLIDTDGNFSNATVHTTGASKSGSEITFTTADISAAGNGLYFSLAGPLAKAPGDVLTNLQFWIKADAGVYADGSCSVSASDGNELSCWADQSPQGNNVTETAALEKPDLISVSSDEDFNFNPSVHFDGGDHLVRSALLNSGDDVSIFAVFRNETLTGDDTIIGFDTDGGDPGLETSGTTLNIQNDDSTPTDVAHGTTLTINTTYLSAIRATNGTNAGVDVRLNGDEDTDATYDMVTIGAEVGVGADQANASTDAFDGEIAEIVVYDADLSDLNTRKVESYLALKYGVAIDQTAGTSYLASNCTTVACSGGGEVEMWDSGAVDAATYDNDIAGIGQDDDSELLQVKSRSVSSDSIITISAASDLENLEFFTWGNDDASVSATSSEVPGGLPGSATVRLTREWLAQHNGGDEVGTVTVTFDLNRQTALAQNAPASNYALLIDTDGIFSNATVHTTGASMGTGTITFTLANISSSGNGLYFTLAGPEASGPGNVSANLELWLKANTGVFTDTGCATAASDTNNIGCWEDQSTQNNDVTEAVGGEQPTLASTASDIDFNYNPSVSFDGGDHLTRATMLAGGDDVSIFTVFLQPSFAATTQIFGYGADSDDPGLETTAGAGLIVRNDASAPATLTHGTTLVTNTPVLASIRATNALNNGVDLRLNGDEDTDATFDMTNIGAEVAIGADYTTASTDALTGEVAEIVVYNSNLSDLNIRKVESYLALKYGIAIDQTAATSYLSSNCTTVACNGGSEVEMWDSGAADASTYDNDIAGIGIDINSDLNQSQSRSTSDDGMVIVSAAADLDDLEFFTWGNDDGGLDSFAFDSPGGLPGSAIIRMSREWLAQNNGGDGVGSVTVTFDLSKQTILDRASSAGNYALLIDTDGNFGDATVHTTGATKNGAQISFTLADISSAGDGLYFSLAGPVFTHPGGVGQIVPPLSFWVKADAGLYSNSSCSTITTDGDSVGCWQDQSENGSDVLESVAGDQPQYDDDATDEDFNFNPSLDFDGSDHLSRDTLIASGDSVTIFAVYQNDSLSGTDTILGFDSDGDDPGLQTNGTDYQIVQDGSTPNPFGHSATLTEFTTYLSTAKITNGTNTTALLRLNGDEESEANFDMSSVGAQFAIGADYDGTGNEPLDGEIAEVIVYNSELSTLNQQKVESYLALKYGVELDQTSATSYLSSNCTTVACNGGGEVMMWNSGAPGASTYDNDLAGIGRDDFSGLGQVKSKSVSADSVVTISAESEGSNSIPVFVDIADREFMVWGNNNGSAGWTSTDAPSTFNILSRQWAVQETNGDVGTITLEVNVDDTEFNFPGLIKGVAYFLVIDTDNDGSFADESTLPLTNTSGSLWQRTSVNIDDGQLFTFATRIRVGPLKGSILIID